MTRVEVLPRNRSGVFLDRSHELCAQMDRASSEKAWNATGVLGVHATIAACDALTVAKLGQRWRGQDHRGVRDLLASVGLPDAAPALRQVADILEQKNKVEYEARAFSQSEAVLLRKKVTRVVAWVDAQLRR